MTYTYDEDLSVWDQRLTLRPPPYTGALQAYLKGIDIGDPVVDALPASELICHGSKKQLRMHESLRQVEEPEWVDWDQVARGQQLWMKHLGRSYFALGHALLVGFSIARFGEVLLLNGYAQSAETAFERYRETGFAIIDWFKFDLSDPTSRAREQIYRVRLMHGLARRNATKLFRKDLGEGIALSQYDMAEVLLGFSAFSLMFLESEMGVHFSEEEKRDMVACWRLIGYHLGIHDEFNLCRSLEHLDDCFADYMVHTKRRILTARDCTHRLQQTAVDGFGLGSGLGSEVWWGFLSAFRSSSKWDGTSLTKRQAKPGMERIGAIFRKALCYDFVNSSAGKELLTQREEWKFNEKRARLKLRVTTALGKFSDQVLWRLYSFLYKMKRIFGILALVGFVRFVRSVAQKSNLRNQPVRRLMPVSH